MFPRILPSRRLIAAAVLVLAPAACASEPLSKPLPAEPGPSLAGNYLAGRHALSKRDAGTAASMLLRALEQDKDNKTLRRLAFIASLRDGRIIEALPLARIMASGESNGEIARLTLAVQGLKDGKLDVTHQHLDALDKKNTYRFLIPLLRAWSEAKAGTPNKAIKALAPLTKRKGFETLVTLHTGLILDQAGRHDDAATAFDVLQAQASQLSLHVVQVLGAFWQRQGEAAKARTLYESYLKRQPASHAIERALGDLDNKRTPPHFVRSPADGAAEALTGLASALSQQNAEDTAEIFIRLALHLKSDMPTAQLLLASLLEDDDRFEAANAVYAGIADSSPMSLTAKIRRADNLDRLGHTDEAVLFLREVARLRPTDPKPMLDLGDILRRHKRFNEAVDAYEEGLKRIGTIRKQHWPILYTQGIALEQSGDWDRAEDRFLRALNFDPDQPLVLNYLGYSWVEKGKNLKRAEAMIRKAVSLRPSDGYIVDSLGWVLFQIGKIDEAVKELERAVELRAEDPVINDHLGDAYWQVGRHREAVFQWKRVLGLDPDDDVAERARAKIKNGLKDAAGSKK